MAEVRLRAAATGTQDALAAVWALAHTHCNRWDAGGFWVTETNPRRAVITARIDRTPIMLQWVGAGTSTLTLTTEPEIWFDISAEPTAANAALFVAFAEAAVEWWEEDGNPPGWEAQVLPLLKGAHPSQFRNELDWAVRG